MFHGSIPNSVQRILGDIVSNWNIQDIYVGCSGNFTIERTLRDITKARLHGNDVTVYSCLLGRYFAGMPLEARIRDDYNGRMAFVGDYAKDDVDLLTIALLLSKMSVYLGSKKSNAYYDKMIKAYTDQWQTIFTATREKIDKIEPFLSSFYAGDVCGWIDTIPEDSAFICYPPFYSGDYEKMFRVIEDVIEWDPPAYDMIDKDKIFEMFRKMTRRKNFMFGTNDELPEFRQHLVGIAQTTNRGVPLYVYASAEKRRIVMPKQKTAAVRLERLAPDKDIGANLKIVPLKSEEFHALRSQYMNVHIKPGSETASFAVTVDHKLIGVFAFSSSPTLSNWDKHIETPTMYLLSDFPVAPTKYRRMAKLVLYAALSKEAKLLAERLTSKRVKSLVTTAFSKRPVSMKYRGLFQILTKKKMEQDVESGSDGDISWRYYNDGYQLNYGAAMGQWTLQEGFELWKKKHSKTEGSAEL
jgi:hypothetical protein